MFTVNEQALYIPDAFTPNNDGLNDIFIPKGTGLNEHSCKFLIYDRWGNKVFESNNLSDGWNGCSANTKEKVQQDVYVWLLEVTDVLGKNHRRAGTVALVR